jgi:hypothetical protein
VCVCVSVCVCKIYLYRFAQKVLGMQLSNSCSNFIPDIDTHDLRCWNTVTDSTVFILILSLIITLWWTACTRARVRACFRVPRVRLKVRREEAAWGGDGGGRGGREGGERGGRTECERKRGLH